MSILKPPTDLKCIRPSSFVVFLAGSIEMGTAEDWQSKVEKVLNDEEIVLLNPRRGEWNNSWKSNIKNTKFREQVTWELDGLERADLIIMYFSPQTKSPISLLELGLFAHQNKLVVCCPKGFWRKGNVDMVCERYKIKQVSNFKKLISYVKKFEKRG